MGAKVIASVTLLQDTCHLAQTAVQPKCSHWLLALTQACSDENIEYFALGTLCVTPGGSGVPFVRLITEVMDTG